MVEVKKRTEEEVDLMSKKTFTEEELLTLGDLFKNHNEVLEQIRKEDSIKRGEIGN